MAKNSTKISKDISFEDALLRLEQIVKNLEDKDVPLEDLIGFYKEGNELSKHCFTLLEQAKSEIVIAEDKD